MSVATGVRFPVTTFDTRRVRGCKSSESQGGLREAGTCIIVESAWSFCEASSSENQALDTSRFLSCAASYKPPTKTQLWREGQLCVGFKNLKSD